MTPLAGAFFTPGALLSQLSLAVTPLGSIDECLENKARTRTPTRAFPANTIVFIPGTGICARSTRERELEDPLISQFFHR